MARPRTDILRNLCRALSDWRSDKKPGRDPWAVFRNRVLVFRIYRLFFHADYLEPLHWSLKLMGGLQTIFGVILLFFLGLGQRTRFRLR